MRGAGPRQGQPRSVRTRRSPERPGTVQPAGAAETDRRHPGGAWLRPAAQGDRRPARDRAAPAQRPTPGRRCHPDGHRRGAAVRRGHPERDGRGGRRYAQRTKPPAHHRRGADPSVGDSRSAHRPGTGQGRHHRIHRLAMEPPAPGPRARAADPSAWRPGHDPPDARRNVAGGLQPLYPGTAAGPSGHSRLAASRHPGRCHYQRRVLPGAPGGRPCQPGRADSRRRRGQPAQPRLSDRRRGNPAGRRTGRANRTPGHRAGRRACAAVTGGVRRGPVRRSRAAAGA
ncbi:hypothetical protein D3C77_461890 [compost metagenome]